MRANNRTRPGVGILDMKKQFAFMTWLLDGGKKKVDAPTDALEKALNPIAPEPPAPFVAVPLAATPPAEAHVAVAPVPATIIVDNIPVSTYSFVPQKPSESLHVSAAVDDPFEEFLVHMKSGKRPFRKPGITVKEEYELWLAHRTKTRQAEAAKAPAKLSTEVRLQA